MKFNSMFVKIKQGDRLVYKLRDESLRCELEAVNIEIINKFNLSVPNRNAIIKSLIQFLSQGSIYCNQSNLTSSPIGIFTTLSSGWISVRNWRSMPYFSVVVLAAQPWQWPVRRT